MIVKRELKKMLLIMCELQVKKRGKGGKVVQKKVFNFVLLMKFNLYFHHKWGKHIIKRQSKKH